jgi:hypothetical protein
MAAIKVEITDQEITMCWEALYLLRPMLQAEHFVNKRNAKRRLCAFIPI